MRLDELPRGVNIEKRIRDLAQHTSVSRGQREREDMEKIWEEGASEVKGTLAEYRILETNSQKSGDCAHCCW